jgi:hypothetical protein
MTLRITWMIITLAFLLFIIFGCTKPPPRIETQPLPEIGDLLKKVAENRQGLRDFEGFGRIILKTPSVQQAFGIHAYYQAPDAYKIAFQGVLGLELGSLTIVGDEYSIQTLGSAVSMHGRLTEAPIEAVLGPAIKPDNLTDLVNPLISFGDIPEEAEFQKDLEAQQYCLTWQNGGLHHCWLAPYRPIVTRWLLKTENGDTLWFRDNQDIKEYSGVAFPVYWEVVAKQGENAQRFQIKFSTIRINRGLPRSIFKIES